MWSGGRVEEGGEVVGADVGDVARFEVEGFVRVEDEGGVEGFELRFGWVGAAGGGAGGVDTARVAVGWRWRWRRRRRRGRPFTCSRLCLCRRSRIQCTGNSFLLPLHLLRNSSLDFGRHPYPRKRAQLRHPPAAQQPRQDVEIGFLVVLAGDDVAVRLRRPRQHGQHLRQTRQGRKPSGVQRRGGGESAHVGVGRDDVGVALVQRRDGAGAAPVDEVRGEELDVGEGDVGGGGDLGEGFGRGGRADVVGQGRGELAGGLVDVFEDAGFVVEEEEGEVAGQVGVFGRGVVGQGGGGCEPEAGDGGLGGGGEDRGRCWHGDL